MKFGTNLDQMGPRGASTWLRKNVTESTKNDQKCEVKLLASWAHPGSKLAPNFTSMHSRMYAKHLEGVLVHGDRMETSGSQPSPFIVMWVWPRNTDQKHIKTWKNVKKKSPPPQTGWQSIVLVEIHHLRQWKVHPRKFRPPTRGSKSKKSWGTT